MDSAAGRVGISLALLVLAGCGRGEVKLVQVQGKVLYQGQPLPGGTLVFAPDAERGCAGPLAIAEIKADGQYVLQTGGKAGAVPGWHRVTVAAPAGSPFHTSSWILPQRFSHPEQSGQVQEVKPGILNAIDIKLE